MERKWKLILIIFGAMIIVLQILSWAMPKRAQKMAVGLKSEWHIIYNCGSCGFLSDTKWRYCPICGADMSGHDEIH